MKYLWSHPVWTALQRKIIRLSCKLNTNQGSSKKTTPKKLQGLSIKNLIKKKKPITTKNRPSKNIWSRLWKGGGGGGVGNPRSIDGPLFTKENGRNTVLKDDTSLREYNNHQILMCG